MTAAGKIVGNIIATKSIDIITTGDINGNITTPILNIAPGSKFKGNCTICSADEVHSKGTQLKEEPTKISSYKNSRIQR